MILVLVFGLAALPGCVSKAELDECKALVVEQDGIIGKQIVQLEEKDAQIEELEAGILKDPSYDELIEFMIEDGTDKEEYFRYGNSDCSYILYAKAFLDKARENGMKGYLVVARISSGELWFFTGFHTVDKGWIYILPTMDEEVNLEIGKKYCELNTFANCNLINDKIEEITIFDCYFS